MSSVVDQALQSTKNVYTIPLGKGANTTNSNRRNTNLPTSAGTLIFDRRNTSQGNPVNSIRKIEWELIFIEVTRRSFNFGFAVEQILGTFLGGLGGAAVFSKLEMLSEFIRGKIRVFVVAQGKFGLGNLVVVCLDAIFFNFEMTSLLVVGN